MMESNVLIELRKIGDKLADAAQAMIDHRYGDTALDEYDEQMHRLELINAIEDWLKARRTESIDE